MQPPLISAQRPLISAQSDATSQSLSGPPQLGEPIPAPCNPAATTPRPPRLRAARRLLLQSRPPRHAPPPPRNLFASRVGRTGPRGPPAQAQGHQRSRHPAAHLLPVYHPHRPALPHRHLLPPVRLAGHRRQPGPPPPSPPPSSVCACVMRLAAERRVQRPSMHVFIACVTHDVRPMHICTCLCLYKCTYQLDNHMKYR